MENRSINRNYEQKFKDFKEKLLKSYNNIDYQDNDLKFLLEETLERLKEIEKCFESIPLLADDFHIFNYIFNNFMELMEIYKKDQFSMNFLKGLNLNLYEMRCFFKFRQSVYLLENNLQDVNFKSEKIQSIKTELENEAEDFRRKRNISDNAKTENIYDQAVFKYRTLEKDYRRYFYYAITATVGLSLLGLFFKNWLVDNNYLGNIEFWVLKVSILAVGITLITYFLKQSSHYQRLADQNYQTQVELQAYPSFMESIPTEEAASVRKELALKYFGREIDGAAHKDMSNLISDQMKSTTEMVKAATDVLKAKG